MYTRTRSIASGRASAYGSGRGCCASVTVRVSGCVSAGVIGCATARVIGCATVRISGCVSVGVIGCATVKPSFHLVVSCRWHDKR